MMVQAPEKLEITRAPDSDIWLVVSTPLKNISQNGNLPQIGVKIKKLNHHLDIFWGEKLADVFKSAMKYSYLPLTSNSTFHLEETENFTKLRKITRDPQVVNPAAEILGAPGKLLWFHHLADPPGWAKGNLPRFYFFWVCSSGEGCPIFLLRKYCTYIFLEKLIF